MGGFSDTRGCMGFALCLAVLGSRSGFIQCMDHFCPVLHWSWESTVQLKLVLKKEWSVQFVILLYLKNG